MEITGDNILYSTMEERDRVRVKLIGAKYSRKRVPVESMRWYVLLQLEKDYQRHIDNLQWTIEFLKDNM